MRILKPRGEAVQGAVDVADLSPAPVPVAPAPKAAPKPTRWPGMDLLNDPITAAVLMSVWSGDNVVTVPSPPGSGKTRLTVLLAAALAHRAGLRVGIAAQTRAQAVDIARRLAAVCDLDKIGILWGRSDLTPDMGGCTIMGNGVRVWPDTGGCVRVATKSKWLFSEPSHYRADVLVVDEAYQATYADVAALGAMAEQIVCVGDPGQIDPVITGDTSRWDDSPTGPQVPAPFALQAAYPDVVNVVKLPYTWRLGPVTTELVQSRFYPELPFTSKRPAEHLSKRGDALPELTHRTLRVANGATDTALIGAAVERVHELIDDVDLVTDAGTRHLTEHDVAVVVPHVPQAAAVRAMLADYPGVLVGTADALQGLERAAVVAIHPLAGKRIADDFSVKPGRACVMLSRHRSHLSLLIDDQTATVLRSGDQGDANVALASTVVADMLASDEF